MEVCFARALPRSSRSVAGILALIRGLSGHDVPSIRPEPMIEQIVVSKRQLREAISRTIAALDPEHRHAQEHALAARFPDLPGLAGAETVLLYVSAFPEEIEDRRYLGSGLRAGKPCSARASIAPTGGCGCIGSPTPGPTASRSAGNPRAARRPARGRPRVDRLGARPRPGLRRARLPPGPRRRALRPPAARGSGPMPSAGPSACPASWSTTFPSSPTTCRSTEFCTPDRMIRGVRPDLEG